MPICYGDIMKNFRELKEEFDKLKNKELEKTGIFYAFSNEQWEKYKTHKDAQDNEYLSVGCGAYIHKSNKKKLDDYFKKILPQIKKDFASKIEIDDLIEYELSNRECYYTGEWDEIIPIIADYFPTMENEMLISKIKNVYYSNLTI